jgi:hypothetical protein
MGKESDTAGHRGSPEARAVNFGGTQELGKRKHVSSVSSAHVKDSSQEVASVQPTLKDFPRHELVESYRCAWSRARHPFTLSQPCVTSRHRTRADSHRAEVASRVIGPRRSLSRDDRSAKAVDGVPTAAVRPSIRYTLRMTRTLDAAIAKLAALPAEEQDRVGNWLLEELRDEDRWATQFAGSRDALSKLADEARADLTYGKTNDLDPDKL